MRALRIEQRRVDIDPNRRVIFPETLRQLEQDPRFAVVVGSTEGETLLAINNARPPFNDIRVRRALAHAVDREALIEGAMYGYGTPIGSHFSPHDPAYLDLTGKYPYDPARAKALLREAGSGVYTGNVELPMIGTWQTTVTARRQGGVVGSAQFNITAR